jgi:uncharacterized protein YkwD
MHYLRGRQALVLLAALLLLLSACNLTVNVDPDLLPTGLARLPTTVAELPTTVAELPTTVAELPTTVAELPTTVAELPTTVAELPRALVPSMERPAEPGGGDFSPGILPPLPTASPGTNGQPGEDLVAQIIHYTNEYRLQNGCGPVAGHPSLHDVAQRYAQHMAEGDFFAHEAPDGSTLADRIEAVDYAYRIVGENLAAGFSSPQAVVDNWMQSAEHRENMLNCQFEDIGVGHYFLEQDPGQEVWNHYWVQVLGVE